MRTMIKRSLFRLIIITTLQSIILTNTTHLMTNSSNYMIYQRINITSPLENSQENSSLDLTPPIITRPADVSYLVNTTGHNLTWYIADKNPGNYSIQHNYQYLDNERNKTWTENQSVSISIDNLPIGIHIYTIIVDDLWGNRISDDVLVTVKESANIPTFNYTNNIPANLADILELFFFGGFYLFIIISIIVIIFSIIKYRKRHFIYTNLPPEDPFDLESFEDEDFL